jgi:hypothetical protein
MTPPRSASLAKLAAELAEPEPAVRERELVVAPELVAQVLVVPVAEPAEGAAADKIRGARLNHRARI